MKNRYKEIAGDHIKKGVKFTHQEDLVIAQLFEQFNTSWTAIAEYFPDRTPVMIKNRYYSHIRRKGLLPDLVSEAHGSRVIEQEAVDETHQDFECEPCLQENALQALPEPEILILNQVPQENQPSNWQDEKLLCFREDSYLDLELSPEDELHQRVTPSYFSEHFQYSRRDFN